MCPWSCVIHEKTKHKKHKTMFLIEKAPSCKLNIHYLVLCNRLVTDFC